MEHSSLLSGDQIDVLSKVYIVLLSFSLIGSFSVLVVSLVKWKYLRQQVHLLVQLALADLLAALILMYTSVMSIVRSDYSVTLCKYMLPLSLTFYLISFLVVAVYAWKSKTAIEGWRERTTDEDDGQSQCRRQVKSLPIYGIVWLIPFAMYLAYVLTPFVKTTMIPLSDRALSESMRNESTYCRSCILFLHIWGDSCSDAEIIHDTVIKVFLILVVIPVMISCSIIYYNIGKWYERHEQERFFPVEGDGRSSRRLRRVVSTARNMVMVILICWAPALVLILLSTLVKLTSIEQRSLFGLYLLQAATVSLQGFLNSMVYAWRRPNFTEAVLGENTPLVAYDRIAYFDESFRNCS
ncbi:transmembrane protein 116 [Melanotaenia boesemani]|uniref:transmembrane protein 116 n=1 Tax=Melanotaenia boesemani TaxID=1250792 RepID=UPI001C042EAF|nr:transmembrane protein 116 [Melanotaenia boesemani]